MEAVTEANKLPQFRFRLIIRVIGRWARYRIIAPTFLRDELITPWSGSDWRSYNQGIKPHGREQRIIYWAGAPNDAMMPANWAAALIVAAQEAIPSDPYRGPFPRSSDVLPWSAAKEPLRPTPEKMHLLYPSVQSSI